MRNRRGWCVFCGDRSREALHDSVKRLERPEQEERMLHAGSHYLDTSAGNGNAQGLELTEIIGVPKGNFAQ